MLRLFGVLMIGVICIAEVMWGFGDWDLMTGVKTENNMSNTPLVIEVQWGVLGGLKKERYLIYICKSPPFPR